jgi:intracellular multiplication protein IcmK
MGVLGCNKHLLVIFTVLTLTFPALALADDTAASAGATSDSSSGTDAVDKFKQWLKQRDKASKTKLDTMSASDQKATAAPVNPVSTGSLDAATMQDAAFQHVVQSTMPMSPDQIRKFRGLIQETQKAAAEFPGAAPPKPVSSTLVVNMAPGSTPPAVRMYQGFITSLVFVDSSGALWPVESYDLGNSKAFNIQWDRKSNVLMVQPQQAYTLANLAVKLKGLSTPVMLTLVPGQAYVDYRVDLRVNGLGPNATHTMHSGLPALADSDLIGVLDNIPPSGANRLKVEGGLAEAWELGGMLYIRTRFTLLSPAWINVMSSPDGMRAYKLQATPSILISQYGKPVAAKIQGV